MVRVVFASRDPQRTKLELFVYKEKKGFWKKKGEGEKVFLRGHFQQASSVAISRTRYLRI